MPDNNQKKTPYIISARIAMFGVLGAMAFSIYAAKENFNVENQSEEMPDWARFASELMQQASNCLSKAATCGIALGLPSLLIEYVISCCQPPDASISPLLPKNKISAY